MKNSSKILNRRNITKKSTFSVLLTFWRGVTKLEAFQWYKVTKLNPSKPSPLVCHLKINNKFAIDSAVANVIAAVGFPGIPTVVVASSIY